MQELKSVSAGLDAGHSLDQMPSSPSGDADIHTVVLHLLASNFEPGTLKTFEDYTGACHQATNTVSLLDFQTLSDEVQNLVVDVLEAAVINLNVSMSVECWDALFELFRTVERLLGEYSHYLLYLRIAAIEVVMLEQPLMSDSMLEVEYSFRNIDISRTPSPLSSLASLSSLRNFTPSPSEMILDSHNEPPLTAEPLEEVEVLHALDKCPSPADTDSFTSDTTMPSSNSLCLTLIPTQNILVEDVAPLDKSQSSAAGDDDLEKKGKKILFRSRKPSRGTMGSRKRATSMREDKENLGMDIAL
ncbi:uncharacterized protein ARMOST_11798 [Armillaria ostoyae]|uniref:Uncharacterized protein n=1 Tax=Armillaria ostoyae TaxID=47428 RepID=A0A284RI48_ARMOS|nr:uncharacterized protein ARMOST_11798 [Armillaria ostoyae]